MPGGDRTGPLGEGPMTGRGMGFCAGYPAPRFAQPGPGGGFGRGWGFGGAGRGGRGWRHRFFVTGVPGWRRAGWTPETPQSERQWLEARAREIENELAAIRAQLDRAGSGADESESGGRE
ncbi:MAG: DUF5320 domain-containing protein [Thermoanaerobaculaceae bacterium]|nr:DUF5320 domain-containing protein [Thermoanaerobaculaceae bacterium]MDI9623216.1 DUF5320 domain-containing protein [Acidobacteriota bacterium]NLH12468.1 DUF5320 domain-containing protein [Holophagae bacterium]